MCERRISNCATCDKNNLLYAHQGAFSSKKMNDQTKTKDSKIDEVRLLDQYRYIFDDIMDVKEKS